MRKTVKRKGFTMIETTLFLTITIAMLVAFMATIAGRIGVQRYSDATQSFLSFMRSVYSQAINVQNVRSGNINSQNANCTVAAQKDNILQNTLTIDDDNNIVDTHPGKSDCAIYGKMISFGENEQKKSSADQHRIYVYDVIGRVVDFNHPTSGGSINAELSNVYADVLSIDADDGELGGYSLTTAAQSDSYLPEWETWIEDASGKPFTGTVLIVRSPSSGAIRTLFLKKTLPIQEMIADRGYQGSIKDIANTISSNGGLISDYLKSESNDSQEAFVMEDVNFCLSTGSLFTGVGQRNNIRLHKDGRDSSAVEFVETDKSKSEGGNVCRS